MRQLGKLLWKDFQHEKIPFRCFMLYPPAFLRPATAETMAETKEEVEKLEKKIYEKKLLFIRHFDVFYILYIWYNYFLIVVWKLIKIYAKKMIRYGKRTTGQVTLQNVKILI